MKYNKTGDFNISKFTLGTVQLGMNYGIANKTGKPDKEKSFKILKAAVAGGINSFDTAREYGDSEEVLGDFFTSDQYSLTNPLLITKFTIEHDSRMQPADIERLIYCYVEASLSRLKINKLPIYMIHNAKDMIAHGKAIADTFNKLIRDGLVGKAAVSVYTGEEAAEVLKYNVYEAIQVPMNIFDGRLINSGILKKLHQKGIITFVRSVFLQGLFLMDPGALKGNLAAAEPYLKKLAALAESEGISIGQLAMSYIRDMEEVTSLVMGVDTVEQVVENIRMIEGPSISEKTRNIIQQEFKDVPVYILNPGLWYK